MRRTVVKVCAIVGVLLVWLPVLAPLLFSLVRLARGAPWMVDWLMPAELFPMAIAGGLLLLAAALLGKFRRWLVGSLLAAAVAMLGSGLVIAQATGLASGAIEPAGWPFALVTGLIIGYAVALAALGVAGIVLVRDVFAAQTAA